MQFSLDATREYIIYGASFLGKQFLQTMTEHGLQVKYFIDQQHDKFPIVDNLPVLPLTKYVPADSEPDNTVVIIAVTNRHEHIWIAQSLLHNGYQNVLYYNCQNEAAPQNRVYEALTEGRIDSSMLACSCDSNQASAEYAYSYQQDVVAYVPAELMYYQSNDALVSIFEPSQLLQFFRFVEGRNVLPDIEDAMTTSAKAHTSRALEKARTLHFNYSHILELGQACQRRPAVRWEKNRFVIESDLDWILFLFAKNFLRFQCRMRPESHQSWLYSSMEAPIWDSILQNNISFLYTPIPYPAFYDYPAKRESAGFTRLMEISNYLQRKKIDVRGKRLLDVGTYIGYFAQHFCRVGAKVTAVEYDATNYELTASINRLLRCDAIELYHCGIEALPPSDPFDVTIMLTVLYWHLHTELAEKIIAVIDRVTAKYMLWESGDEIDYEIDWILGHSSFKGYERICPTFGTGKMREMGCFYK